ncbi:MAG: type I-D CRISPR-associated protein Cas5/Csc1 [Caldilineaceae bacterium]|nr:type I-D CRISPR-associated protein Cas5/Csc1 [Caldilineaceae bacterium]
MHIYRCTLTLMEPTFFSSREVSATYFTEPLIGNIALSYAFGFCQSPYFNDGTIHYWEHLSALNEQGLYVTPATIDNEPRFSLGQFNAQPDAYWSAMGAGALVTVPEGGWAESKGKAWWVYYPDGRRRKVGAETRPQYGRIRFLAIGNQATAYVLSDAPQEIPSYVRLGKFMSKARVQALRVPYEEVEADNVSVPFLLSLGDLPATMTPQVFDLVNVPPAPLVRNARLSGRFYQVSKTIMLPAGMCYGLAGLS